MRGTFMSLTVMLILASALSCEASRPVSVSSRGCVVGGRLYVIHDVNTVYLYTLTRPMDLRRYEGRLVRLEGFLAPGDRFTPRVRRFKVVGTVSPALRELVSRHDLFSDIAVDEVRLPGARGQP